MWKSLTCLNELIQIESVILLWYRIHWNEAWFMKNRNLALSFSFFSWVCLSSAWWVMIYKVCKSVLYSIFCYALQYGEIGNSQSMMMGWYILNGDCLLSSLMATAEECSRKDWKPQNQWYALLLLGKVRQLKTYVICGKHDWWFKWTHYKLFLLSL